MVKLYRNAYQYVKHGFASSLAAYKIIALVVGVNNK